MIEKANVRLFYFLSNETHNMINLCKDLHVNSLLHLHKSNNIISAASCVCVDALIVRTKARPKKKGNVGIKLTEYDFV